MSVRGRYDMLTDADRRLLSMNGAASIKVRFIDSVDGSKKVEVSRKRDEIKVRVGSFLSEVVRTAFELLEDKSLRTFHLSVKKVNDGL